MAERGCLFSENLCGLKDIQQQIASLRWENCFLKVGLILCLILASLPYLTGFQPDVIRAKKVVTERVEFVRDRKTILSITCNFASDRLDILDEDGSRLVFLGKALLGGMVGIYNNKGLIVASMSVTPNGGMVDVADRYEQVVAVMSANREGGTVIIKNNDEKPVAGMVVTQDSGAVTVCNYDGTPVIGMSVGRYGGGLKISNNDGKTAAVVSTTRDGGAVGVCDKEGKPIAEIVATPLSGKIELKTPLGQTVWSAP